MRSDTVEDNWSKNKISVMKRKFNGDLKARRFTIQMKEIAGKMIVCNIHTFLQFLVIEVFYRAKNLEIIYSEVQIHVNTYWPSHFRIFPQKDTTGCLQKGSIPFSMRTASHSSHSVWRLHEVFGQGQSFRIVGGIGDQPETGSGLNLWSRR
jgi:hypothetical protein